MSLSDLVSHYSADQSSNGTADLKNNGMYSLTRKPSMFSNSSKTATNFNNLFLKVVYQLSFRVKTGGKFLMIFYS